MKINCTESYVFFLARTYRARIQLSFTNTRGIQYSPYVNPCVSPYRVPNLTLGILNVPKHCNKHDLIHFVTMIQTSLTLDSGKSVNFIQTFGPLVSFSYNLVLVLLIFYKI